MVRYVDRRLVAIQEVAGRHCVGQVIGAYYTLLRTYISRVPHLDNQSTNLLPFYTYPFHVAHILTRHLHV